MRLKKFLYYLIILAASCFLLISCKTTYVYQPPSNQTSNKIDIKEIFNHLSYEGCSDQLTDQYGSYLTTFSNNKFRITLRYLEPYDFDVRMENNKDYKIVHVTVINNTNQLQNFNYHQVVIRYGNDAKIPPEEAGEIAKELYRLPYKESKGFAGKFKNFLASQSSGFWGSLDLYVESHYLESKNIAVGESIDGVLVYKIPPQYANEQYSNINPNWAIAEYESSNKPLNSKSYATFTRGAENLSSPPQPPFNKSYALLAGIGKLKYASKFKNLPSLRIDKDISKMVDYLLCDQHFDEVIVVTDDSVSEAVLRYPQEYLKEGIIQENDRFVFYFSGHGDRFTDPVSDKNIGYLPLSGFSGDPLEETILMTELVDWVNALNAKQQLVILDCCFSGLAFEETPIALRRGDLEVIEGPGNLNGIPIKWPDKAFKSAKKILAASGKGELAIEFVNEGGLFTNLLLYGLRTKAHESDDNNDGFISIKELDVWVEDAVSKIKENTNYFINPGLKELCPNHSCEGEFYFRRVDKK